MQEEMKVQQVPVKVFSANGRMTIVAPMPGLEASDITVDVTATGHILLQGKARGQLKLNDAKELLLDEWSVGDYYRDLEVSDPVDGERANVTYGNGVLAVTLPLSHETKPAHLTMEQTSSSHGIRYGNAGHDDI